MDALIPIAIVVSCLLLFTAPLWISEIYDWWKAQQRKSKYRKSKELDVQVLLISGNMGDIKRFLAREGANVSTASTNSLLLRLKELQDDQLLERRWQTDAQLDQEEVFNFQAGKSQ